MDWREPLLDYYLLKPTPRLLPAEVSSLSLACVLDTYELLSSFDLCETS